MAAPYLLRMCRGQAKILNVLPVHKEGFHPCLTTLLPKLITWTAVRTGTTGFFGRMNADSLWESATSVSNAGRKRGRGKGLRRRVDLNYGKKLGIGKSGLRFPGLSGPPMVGRNVLKIHETSREEPTTSLPPRKYKKQVRVPALQRGYSGKKYPGTSIGPPDPINDYVFENFDTRVLEYKMVSHMTGNLGRAMRVSAFVVTGNQQGLAGYALAKAPMGKAALRKAKNQAAQRLQFIELYNGHTVFHNFAVIEHKTKLFVEKMPKGSGLDCHRVVKTICQIIGIQDLKVTVEGRTSNIQNICKGFFRGLMEQETHQKLADRMQLHVIEMRPEYENIPMVVASPSCGKTRSEPHKEEAFDFDNMYYKDGKIPLKKDKDPLEYWKSTEPRWQTYLKRHRDRNQMHARFQRMIYGLEPSKQEVELRKRPLK